MGVNSDDGFKVTAGGAGGTNIYLGSSETLPGTRNDGQFDFAVGTNAIYKLRLVQWERGGGASCEWYWVNRTTGVRDLIRPLAVESAASVTGPYTVDSTAAINPSAKSITVARNGNARYYRLRSSTAYTINSISVQGNSLLLSYQ